MSQYNNTRSVVQRVFTRTIIHAWIICITVSAVNQSSAQTNTFTAGACIGGTGAQARLYVPLVRDFDGDTDKDIIVVDEGSNVRIYKNNGSGGFDAGTQIIAGQFGAMSAGDLDGDGDLDLVHQNGRAYLNNGTGAFTQFGSSPVFTGTGGVGATMIADFNGDGKQDIVFVNYSQNAGDNNQVWLNTGTTGNPSFSLADSWDNTAVGPRGSVTVGDIDGDGDIDIITGASSWSGGVYKNNGSGDFSQHQIANGYNGKIFLIDWDGDNDLDYLQCDSYNAWGVRLRRNDGTGTFETNATLILSLAAGSAELLDVNGDGKADLVIPSGATYYLNTSCAFTQAGQTLSNSNNGIAIGDFNNDGKPDLFCAARDAQSCTWINDLNPGEINWTGGTSGNWNTASNWSSGVVPCETDNVSLSATGVTNEAVISTAVTTANLTLGTNRTLTLSTGGSLTVNGLLTMGGGNITLGNQNMTFGASATVSGAAATKCIVTNGTGTVSRAIAASGSFVFPVGATATGYNPLTIALDTGDPTETFGVRVYAFTDTARGYATTDTSLVVKRLWDISEGTGGGNHAKLTFQWASDEDGSNIGISSGSAVLASAYHFNSVTNRYNLIDNANGPAPGSNPIVVTTPTYAATEFSPYIVGAAGALPVQLASFTGTFVGSSVRLNWRTLSEVNNYRFYVQRRSSGVVEWMELVNSFIAGHGTTNEPQNYSFTDNTAASGQWQYRLKQVDLDGTIHFTEPINVSSPTSVKEIAPIEFALKQNYPNPFNPKTNIKFSVEQTGRATLEIYNLLGQKVATLFDEVVEAGYYQTVKLNGSSLASGMYFYRLQSGKKSDMKKLLLVK